MISRLVRETRLVRYLVTLVALVSFTFLIIRRMKLNAVYAFEPRHSAGRSASSAAQSSMAYNDHHHHHQPSSLLIVKNVRTNGSGNRKYLAPKVVVCAPLAELRLIKRSSRLPPLDSIFRRCLIALLVYKAVNYANHLILRLLKYDFAKSFRFLDCFLFGRLQLNARIAGYMNVTFLCGTLCLIGWPLALLHFEPQYHFDFIEFLLYDYNYLVAKFRKQHRCCRSEAPNDARASHSVSSHPVSSSSSRNQAASFRLESVLEIQAPPNDGACPGTLPRPNRTPEAWLRLAKWLCRYAIIAGALIGFLTVLLTSMIVPLFITKVGFAIEHHFCIDWLLAKPATEAERYSFILKPAELQASRRNATQQAFNFYVSTDNLVAFNWYSVLRVPSNFILNLVFYYSAASIIVSNGILCVLMSGDALIYHEQLDKMLRALVRELQAKIHSIPVAGPSDKTYTQANSDDSFRQARLPTSRAETNDHIDRLQALIVDYFKLVAGYSHFASAFATLSISVWVFFTMMISAWILIPGSYNATHKLEWYTIHALGSINLLVVLCSFAHVRYSSRKLYPWIANAAALDAGCVLRKRRWLIIMCYFDAKSVYCFKLLRAAEISWLLLFKLCMWVFSVLLVVSTFYSNYQA